MTSNLLLLFLTGVLVTTLGCKRSDEKSSEVTTRQDAWWAEKSKIVSEWANLNQGVVVDLRRNHPPGGPNRRRWNVVVPVDSKSSIGDLANYVNNLPDDLMKRLSKADPELTPNGFNKEGDYRLFAGPNYEGGFTVANAGPDCVREFNSEGSSGGVWIKVNAMEKAPSGFCYTVRETGPDTDHRPQMNPKAPKVIFFDIVLTRWK